MQVDRKRIWTACALLAAFGLFTAAVCCVDVQPIGPKGSLVGFASLNAAVHRFTGTHMRLYVLTDWLGLAPVGMMLLFAGLGLCQWVKRRSLAKVDRDLFVLGAFYVLVTAAYLLFEECAVNYRPVLIEGRLEASYPSSTTLLVLCVVPTTVLQLRQRMKNCPLRRGIQGLLIVFAAFMVLARLLSGVHWLTDIAGGMLLGAGLVRLYDAFIPGRE